MSPSVRPFASEEEFQATLDIVNTFQEGVGQELHQKLLQKARTNRNWVCNESVIYFLGVTVLDVLLILTYMFFKQK